MHLSFVDIFRYLQILAMATALCNESFTLQTKVVFALKTRPYAFNIVEIFEDTSNYSSLKVQPISFSGT